MVIPPKKITNEFFFLTFSECSQPNTVSKNAVKIGCHLCKRDTCIMGYSCPIYACTCANHACYSSVEVTFCGTVISGRLPAGNALIFQQTGVASGNRKVRVM